MKSQKPWKSACPPHLYVSVVHMCIYVYMFACVCMLEVRGLCQISSSVALHLMFSKSLSLISGLTNSAKLAAQESSCFCLSSTGVTDAWQKTFFFFFFKSGCWGSKCKLSPHVFLVSILPTALVCLLIQDSATGMNTNKIMNSHQTSVDKRFLTMWFVKSSD